jgi:hypothetical protein
MMEDEFFIEREISYYRAMLKLRMCDKNRAALMRLLTEAEHKLTEVTSRQAQLS